MDEVRLAAVNRRLCDRGRLRHPRRPVNLAGPGLPGHEDAGGPAGLADLRGVTVRDMVASVEVSEVDFAGARFAGGQLGPYAWPIELRWRYLGSSVRGRDMCGLRKRVNREHSRKTPTFRPHCPTRAGTLIKAFGASYRHGR